MKSKTDETINKCSLCGWAMNQENCTHFYLQDGKFICCACLLFQYSRLIIELQERLRTVREKVVN